MKLFNKIKNAVKRLPRKTVATIASLTLLVGVPLAVSTFAEFYPARPTYDYNKPCNPNDNDPYDRCGSLTGPVFNSFVNTPSYGDERSFVDASRTDQTTAGSYKDVLPNVTEGSKEIVVRMYVHNNANADTNATNGVAKNTRVFVFVPTATSQTLRARGYIGADNAAQVEDTVDFTATEEFSLSYIPGSAKLFDLDNFQNGVAVSDSIVQPGGALIGSDAMNGNFKGCFEYAAIIQVRLKVTPKPKPNLEIIKKVRKAGEKDWKTEVAAKPGEEVEWALETKNTGQGPMTNVTTRDILPPHTQLVANTTKFVNGRLGTVPLQDGPLLAGGYNSGLYDAGNNSIIIFKTKLLGDFTECEKRVRNVAKAKSTEAPNEVTDDADVVIKKDNCEEEEMCPIPGKEHLPKNHPDCKEVVNPVYKCEQLNKIFLSKNGEKQTWRFTTTTTQNKATVKQYNYEITGNNNYKVNQISNQANGQFDHEFPGAGTYVIMVTVDFNVEGQGVKSHTSEACKTTITIPKEEEEKCPIPGKTHLPKNSPECKEDVPPTTTTTPPAPTTLVSTGPADLIGIFVATTVAGTLAHYFILGRRYQ